MSIQFRVRFLGLFINLEANVKKLGVKKVGVKLLYKI